MYVADPTAESANPDAVAMALIVTAAVIAIGAVYCVDDGPGPFRRSCNGSSRRPSSC